MYGVQGMGGLEERLIRVAKILEAMGRVALNPEINPYYRRYESSEDVFYHLVATLWAGPFERLGVSPEELKLKGFPTPEKIRKRYEEKMEATNDFREFVERVGGT